MRASTTEEGGALRTPGRTSAVPEAAAASSAAAGAVSPEADGTS